MAGGDVREPGERAEGEHERLRAVGLGHVAVTARDLLALDRAIHGPRGRRNISVLVRRKLRRTVVGGFRIVNTGIGRIRMSDGVNNSEPAYNGPTQLTTNRSEEHTSELQSPMYLV